MRWEKVELFGITGFNRQGVSISSHFSAHLPQQKLTFSLAQPDPSAYEKMLQCMSINKEIYTRQFLSLQLLSFAERDCWNRFIFEPENLPCFQPLWPHLHFLPAGSIRITVLQQHRSLQNNCDQTTTALHAEQPVTAPHSQSWHHFPIQTPAEGS